MELDRGLQEPCLTSRSLSEVAEMTRTQRRMSMPWEWLSSMRGSWGKNKKKQYLIYAAAAFCFLKGNWVALRMWKSRILHCVAPGKAACSCWVTAPMDVTNLHCGLCRQQISRREDEGMFFKLSIHTTVLVEWNAKTVDCFQKPGTCITHNAISHWVTFSMLSISGGHCFFSWGCAGLPKDPPASSQHNRLKVQETAWG